MVESYDQGGQGEGKRSCCGDQDLQDQRATEEGGGGSLEDDEEMERASTASTASGSGQTKKTYARMEFMMETREAQITIRNLLEQMGAEIKNGPAPCLQPTRKVKEDLKALQRMGYGRSN